MCVEGQCPGLFETCSTARVAGVMLVPCHLVKQGEGASGDEGKEKKLKPSSSTEPNGSTPSGAVGGEGEARGGGPFGRVDSSSLTLEATASTLKVRKGQGARRFGVWCLLFAVCVLAMMTVQQGAVV